MKSMTGFGAGRIQLKGVELEINLRSVNGRYLDARFHLPKEYLEFEAQLKKTLQKTFRRGSVDVFVHRRLLTENSGTKLKLQPDNLNRWLKVLAEIAKTAKTEFQLDPIRVAQLPDVVSVESHEGDLKAEKKALFKSFEQAVESLSKARELEGKHLQQELQALVKSLQQQVDKMEALSLEARELMRDRLNERWQNLESAAGLDPQRVAQEMVLYLDRAEVREEIVRLRTHIQEFTRLASERDPDGKKMDFYTQELLREVNTVGSKANHAGLTAVVVEAKSLIEKIREQVQNVE